MSQAAQVQGTIGEARFALPLAVRDFLRAQDAAGWSVLRGTEVRGSVPIREESVSNFLRERAGLPTFGLRLRSVSIHEGNVVRLRASMGSGFLSLTLSPELRLESPTGFPDAPVLTVVFPSRYALLLRGWQRGQPEPLATAVSIGERTAQIRLRELAAYCFGPEIADSVRLLKAVALRSERGALFIDFEATIP